jgi:hypothetical protein
LAVDISLQEADLRISPLYPDLQKPRSEHVLMIEALLSSGTGEDRKRSLLAAIVTRLQAAGTDPNDVMVFFGEIDDRHGGKTATKGTTGTVTCGQKSKVERG